MAGGAFTLLATCPHTTMNGQSLNALSSPCSVYKVGQWEVGEGGGMHFSIPAPHPACSSGLASGGGAQGRKFMGGVV